MKTLIIRLLVILAITPMMIEGLLRWFDPLGAAYFFDLETLGRHSITDETRGYILAPGTYHLARWSVTELPNGERYTPASQTADCTLLVLGDSVAFGQGVNDDKTFANILSSELKIHVVNAAFEGYNSHQVLAALRQHPEADVALYLIISNDMDSTGHFEQAMDIDRFPMTSLYVMGQWTMTHPGESVHEESRFWADLAELATDHVLLFAFDDWLGRAVAKRYPVNILPEYTHHVSYFDAHPNADGHREIATAMLPIVKSAVARHCYI